LVRSLQFGFLAWGNAGRRVAATLFAAAGVYQLTPSKDTSLRRWRDHRMILRDHMRGGLGLGIQHGGFCVGSTWALVVALILAGLSVSVALVPGDLPGFTTPGSHPLPAMQMR
jgi:predicted metal-binding membrane protein